MVVSFAWHFLIVFHLFCLLHPALNINDEIPYFITWRYICLSNTCLFLWPIPGLTTQNYNIIFIIIVYFEAVFIMTLQIKWLYILNYTHTHTYTHCWLYYHKNKLCFALHKFEFNITTYIPYSRIKLLFSVHIGSLGCCFK